MLRSARCLKNKLDSLKKAVQAGEFNNWSVSKRVNGRTLNVIKEFNRESLEQDWKGNDKFYRLAATADGLLNPQVVRQTRRCGTFPFEKLIDAGFEEQQVYREFEQGNHDFDVIIGQVSIKNGFFRRCHFVL